MSRKVFISVLGFTNYGQCTYVKDDYKSSSVRFIQEATLEYLCLQSKWATNDVAYILLTNGAEKANWHNNGHKDKITDKVIECEGLCSRLQKMRLPFNVNTINNLPDGNTEEEIWIIFERVFNELQEGDELYFDLTHGFRYLPMLVMVLINYSKFLKNTSVRSITYGNYESRNTITNEAPIIDLLPLSVLQDWTYAAGQFLNSGNVDQLQFLCDNELKPILKQSQGANKDATNLRYFVKYLNEVICERHTCRGMSIIKSDNLKNLKKTAEQIDSIIIPPLDPIFRMIKKSMSFFDEEENIKNAFSAAVWCFKNGLYQQSATILQEFVVTYICYRHGVRIDDETRRDWVTSAFLIKFKNIPKSDWKLSQDIEIRDMQAECIEKILNDDLFSCSKFVNAFNNLSEVRNDYNHSGMRSKRAPLTHRRIKENIGKCIDVFDSVFHNVEVVQKCRSGRKILINLTNHPSSHWCERQSEAARIYGEVVDMPFPIIDEAKDESYIETIADEYLQKILSLINGNKVTVHLMGELNFTFALLKRLQLHNIPCIASTSKRIVNDESASRKGEVIFQFERFRYYE